MKRLAAVALGAVLLAACGTSAADRAAQEAESSKSSESRVTVDSCGHKLTFDAPPEKVVMLSATGFSEMAALDLVDQIDLRAGDENFGVGQEDLQKQYDGIETMTAGELETGGVRLATETVLERGIDLVIGYDQGVDREALAAAGVQVYSPASFCGNYSVEHATWELIDVEVKNFAAIFGVEERAAEVIKQREADVAGLGDAGLDGQTGIALYITPGNTTFYAYGTSSMVQPIFEANGLKNAYEDTTERVFDGSMEDLLSRNPDWIVLLAADATPEETFDTFAGFQGAEKLKAMAEERVVTLPFSLTDPPSLLSVKGAARLAEEIAAK